MSSRTSRAGFGQSLQPQTFSVDGINLTCLQDATKPEIDIDLPAGVTMHGTFPARFTSNNCEIFIAVVFLVLFQCHAKICAKSWFGICPQTRALDQGFATVPYRAASSLTNRAISASAAAM